MFLCSASTTSQAASTIKITLGLTDLAINLVNICDWVLNHISVFVMFVMLSTEVMMLNKKLSM